MLANITTTMGFLDNIFDSKESGTTNKKQEAEHAVIVQFDYGKEGMDELYQLRDRLENIIEVEKLGEYDGHEMAMDYSDGFLYMYGPNAESLFKGIQRYTGTDGIHEGCKSEIKIWTTRRWR